MFFYVLDILFILFIRITTILFNHCITPVTHVIDPWCKLGYTKDTSYFFRSKPNTCTIFVIHQEPIWTCSCPMVRYVAIVRILVVAVLHSSRYYRVG